ncbi:MAG: D-alanine--D-alanine ligase [Anaerolineaceae bacterium]|nr:D-alanine--D-alanine ligase [Anaerolineaceae bacterium]
MVKKLRLGVIFGGRSGEHEVSLMSARSVLSVLDPAKYEVSQIGITHEGAWFTGLNLIDWMEKTDRQNPISSATILPDPGNTGLFVIEPCDQAAKISLMTSLDVVFPVLHGSFGEDGTLQGLLELANIAYVGAGVLASSVGMDKALFKEVMRARNIPVVDSITITRRQIAGNPDRVIALAEKLGAYPLFVKPANMGSSVGITKCRNQSELIEGLQDAACYDRRILIERSVNAREIEVSVLGNEDARASIPGEILPSDEFYSYNAKYIDNASRLLIPAPLNKIQTTAVQRYAVEAYQAIDCAGMARVDFFIDKDSGEIFLNEVNMIPGFTSISMYPKLWESSGMPYAQLVDELIKLAMERQSERDQTERHYGVNRT